MLKLVARRMLDEIDDLVETMNAVEVELAPGLIADRAIAMEFSASNRANVEHVLAAVVADESSAMSNPPPEAFDVIRTVVRRDIEIEAIFHAYRRGQNVVWGRFMTIAAELEISGAELLDLLEHFADLLFGYVDEVLTSLLAEASRVREEMRGGALARRAGTVRLILDGAPLDEPVASARLGYDLSRSHTALVLWLDGSASDDGLLEATLNRIVTALRVRPPLTVAAGVRTLWAWLPGVDAPDADVVRGALSGVSRTVRAAVGPTQRGLAGFRGSHVAAQEVAALVGDHLGSDRVVFAADVESVLLAGRDVDAAARFVLDTLGDLAAADDRGDRLRETLRIYLAEAENAPRTAERLHTHRNTVLQRVARATDLLGYPPGRRRVAVTLALELAHFLGPAVLDRS